VVVVLDAEAVVVGVDVIAIQALVVDEAGVNSDVILQLLYSGSVPRNQCLRMQQMRGRHG